jgi:CelD/BcsL family acetyltransferase involved in cellulose biosynthesis
MDCVERCFIEAEVWLFPCVSLEHWVSRAVPVQMHVIAINTSEALERLREPWADLWERVPHAGPFQHPDWLITWWHYLGAGELSVFAVYDRAKLVAIAPFYIHSDQASGTRQLTLVGNGISDCCDILIEPHNENAERQLVSHLLAARDVWISYDFRDLPSGSALIRIMQFGFGGFLSEDTPCVVVQLSHWSEGRGTLSCKMLNDLARRCRRAEEHGPVRFSSAGAHDVHGELERLFDLHQSRWRVRGREGVLCGPNLAAFHHEVAERLAKRDWLRLFSLCLGERIVASNYGFCVRKKAYYYIGGFDPAAANIGPGGLLLHHAINDAAREGAGSFSFLRGAEPYKFRWGGVVTPQYRVTSHRNR